MSQVIYPLGHNKNEFNRLDAQAVLLRDSVLEDLAGNSTTCLEIGCGNGSNLELLRQANKQLKYTGIDTSKQAIRKAGSRFKNDKNAEFLVMDGAHIDLPNDKFDLIFTKLVLWSVGPDWAKVLEQANRLLAPGGVFYAFEPCNHLVAMYPPKPFAKRWMEAWDNAALQSGIDPFIGTKVAEQLKRAGFQQIQSQFFPIIATGREQERYLSIMDNLKGFYLGEATQSLMINQPASLRELAAAELSDFTPDSLVMDAFYVSRGTKVA